MKTILLLEDNDDRIVAFQTAVAKIPDAHLVIWKDAHGMIRDLPQRLDGSSLVSLDHDLVAQDGSAGDPGTGLDVCEALAQHPPACPVIVHSTNYERVMTMIRTLEDAGWPVLRVAPVGMGEEWIGTSWLAKARKLMLAEKVDG